MSDPSWLDRNAAAGPRPPVSPVFLLLVVIFAMAGVMLGIGRGGPYGWIISLCLHEFGHAATAYVGGDYSVADKGYLTLDPIRYANPLLSIILPLMFLAMGGIGFPGGSVYVNYAALRSPLWRSAASLAGPAMNLACLIAIAVALKFVANPNLGAALAFLGLLQSTALVLNLLPLPGLDGFGVIAPFLPLEVRLAALRAGNFIGVLLLVVIVAVPQALQPIWSAALTLCTTLGVSPIEIFAGQQLFQFWR